MSIKDDIDKVSRRTGLGALSSSFSNTLTGINHRGAGNPVPINTDNVGLTFFTRPRLNLSYDNIASNRLFLPLMTGEKLSLGRYVRAILDPDGEKGGIDTPLSDPKMAFIPLLSNNLLSLSGWPDMEAYTYTSREGIYKEAYSQVDGPSRIFSTYDLTANFRNLTGDPITFLFLIWMQYALQVYEGLMMPRRESIAQNRYDYNTRIYRVILDPTRTYVQKIGACGAAFPTATPLGAAFNFSMDEPFNRENDQVSIPFKCMGADYQDPILIYEFNIVTAIFNPGMADGRRDATHVKLKPAERSYFNYFGYPRIDPETYELEWWVSSDQYKALSEG